MLHYKKKTNTVLQGTLGARTSVAVQGYTLADGTHFKPRQADLDEMSDISEDDSLTQEQVSLGLPHKCILLLSH